MAFFIRSKLIKVLKLFISFSEEGEDKILLRLLPQTGTYLDVGAYHPWKASNTFMLYLLGWQGTCVDVNNKWKFRLFRHRDKFIYGYVDADNSYHFPKRLFTSDPGLAEESKAKGWMMRSEKKVPRIEATVFRDYDLLNIDVDGLDFFVLRRLLIAHYPKWIVAEDKELAEQKGIYELLTMHGYKRIANTTRNGIYQLG